MNLVHALTFVVLLDGKEVGSHRFELQGDASERRVSSSASFDVRLLGIPVYRYRHEATEQWRGDCLLRIDARTDDNGDTSSVAEAPRGCVMSFAYWNPRMLEQKELLNAQTGRVEQVRVTALGSGRYRIDGPKAPIDLWYGTDGKWLALESSVAGGRRLRYELKR